MPRARITNHETGETYEGAVEFDPQAKVPKARFDAPWMAVFDAGLDILIDRHFTITDYRVWACVCRTSSKDLLEWETRPGVIAVRLGVDVNRVYRSLRVLEEAGLIVRPRKGYLAFPPALFWRGTSASRMDAIRERELAVAEQQDREIAAALEKRRALLDARDAS